MANYINLILDTTPPSNPYIIINNGDLYTTEQLVSIEVDVDDSVTTGYQMLIWGDVDTLYNPDIQTDENQSTWITFSKDSQVKLSEGDGSKAVYVRVRDDVHNASSVASTSINLDTTIADVSTTAPDVSKISKMPSKDTATFTFQSNKDFKEYKVKVVGNINNSHDTGVQIQTTGGSQNTSGTGNYSSSAVITVTIKGHDLQEASSSDGSKIIKVFVKDTNDIWSA